MHGCESEIISGRAVTFIGKKILYKAIILESQPTDRHPCVILHVA